MYDLLKGVRVLDLTSVVLGPFATQYLGDFGADVIKIEPPSGDIFRYARPARTDNMGAGFLNMNRNKRSLCLDLKESDDLAQFHLLLQNADVLVHNMRASAAARLGLAASELHKSNPQLVYCAAPGYGSKGRNADKPAYDDIMQAATGIAALNRGGEGEPRFVPTILCDKVSGMHLAMAVLAGVTHQAKTGKGCVIEAPMFEGMVAFMMAEHLSGETFRPANETIGYDRLLSEHRRPHRTKDGYIGVLPYSGEHWMRILEFIDSELAVEEWVQSTSERSARIGELYSVLASAMLERTTDDWINIFNELDIPCSLVNSLQDLLEEDHLRDVGMFYDTEHPTEGLIRSIRSPFLVEGVAEAPDLPAPNLQQKTEKKTEKSDEAIAWHKRNPG